MQMPPPPSVRLTSLAYTPFAEAELRRLDRFLRQSRALRDSSFFAHPGHRMKALVGVTGVSNLRVDSPGEEAVRATVPIFRELFVDTNRTSAIAVLKMLDGHARARNTVASKEVVQELRALRGELRKRRKADRRSYVLEEGRTGPIPPDEIISLWLNGEYLHFDEGKANALSADTTVGELYRMSLHSALRDFCELWEQVAFRAEAVLRDPSLRN